MNAGQAHLLQKSPYISAKEPYISTNEPYKTVKNVIVNSSLDYRSICPKNSYIYKTKSPLFSAKEPYISTNEPYKNVENVIVNVSLDYRALSAKKPYTYAGEPLFSRKRALYFHKRAMKDCSENDSKCTRYACYDKALFIHRFFRQRTLYFCKRTMKVCSRYNSESLMHDKVFIRKVTT